MIAVIDYGAGNLRSVELAFEAINAPARITNDPAVIESADRVVFPGVGSARHAMSAIDKSGLTGVLKKIANSDKPFLGICLGTQIIFQHLEEDGGVEGLGLIPGQVKAFTPEPGKFKVPHMGWNTVTTTGNHPLMRGIESESEFYFVHSFYPAPETDSVIIGKTDYAGVNFASVVGKDNLFATQFHPEKSGVVGLKLLKNFTTWSGKC